MKRERRYWNSDKKCYESEEVDESFDTVAMMPVSPEVAIFQREDSIDIISDRGTHVFMIKKEDWNRFAHVVNLFTEGLNET